MFQSNNPQSEQNIGGARAPLAPPVPTPLVILLLHDAMDAGID